MKIIVTKEQFELLLVNFNILGDKELAIQMNGTVFNKIVESKKTNGNLKSYYLKKPYNFVLKFLCQFCKSFKLLFFKPTKVRLLSR